MIKDENKHENINYYTEDKVATGKDLMILRLELEHKITSITIKLGCVVIACSSILGGLITYIK